MTPRQVKRLRERIQKKGYWRDRAIEIAERAAAVQVDLIIAAKKDISKVRTLDRILTRLNIKLGWYFGRI